MKPDDAIRALQRPSPLPPFHQRVNLATILSAMRLADERETTRIHRVAGLPSGRTAVVATRPSAPRTTPSPMSA
jgi:hypothetical protein